MPKNNISAALHVETTTPVPLIAGNNNKLPLPLIN
jgi:hypothetical protein